MPVGLSPNTGQPTKSESIAISVSYADLSTFCGAPNPAAVGGLSPWRAAAYLGPRSLAARVVSSPTDTVFRGSRLCALFSWPVFSR